MTKGASFFYKINTRSIIKRLTLLVATMIVAFAGVPTIVSADAGYNATSGRPFASWSVWNSAIRSNPTLDANTSGIVSLLSSNVINQATANMYDLGVPIYFVDASTPLVSVTCTNSPAWGVCPFTQVRIPVNARPQPGVDGALVIVDTTNQKSYEFWQAQKINDTQWQTSWGGVADDVVNGAGDKTSSGSSVAAGTPRLAGVILEREIAAGVIPHALVFASKYACQSPSFRFPATKTDGPSADSNCIPEGARVQLDPSINVDALPGITAGEKAVAKALQTYGAYCIDKSDINMAFSFELPASATPTTKISSAYLDAGLGWDYFGMNAIPWNKLRVLSNWDGATGAAPTGPDTTTPTVPVNLRTTSLARTSVGLAWGAASDNVGVTKYNVWRGDSNWANWSLIAQVSGGVTNYTDRTVKSGVAYTYAVRAQDAAGNISASSNAILVPTRR